MIDTNNNYLTLFYTMTNTLTSLFVWIIRSKSLGAHRLQFGFNIRLQT